MNVGRPIVDCGSGTNIDIYVLKDGTVIQAIYSSNGSISKIKYMQNGEWVTKKY